MNHAVNEWAKAIAERVSAVPKECMRLVGTGIIEK